jgi:hypothetical protein
MKVKAIASDTMPILRDKGEGTGGGNGRSITKTEPIQAEPQPISKKVIEISKDLNSSLVSLMRQLDMAVADLSLRFGDSKRARMQAGAGEIGEALKLDTSETGKAMTSLLLKTRSTGKIGLADNYPFNVPGLRELEEAKLVDRLIVASATDSKTYASDPFTYVLTPLGETVAEYLYINTVKREFVGAPDSD